MPRFPTVIPNANHFSGALDGKQEAPTQALSAELGSLSLEFTRLTQLTGDAKYFDAVQRITNQFEKHQNNTIIPGLFPILVDPRGETFSTGRTFTFGGMSDSLYEYFPKQHMLLGGLVDQYRNLYERAIEAAKQHLFFRPLTPQNQDILISGTVTKNAADIVKLQPEGQHLACFTGGMVGIGSKIFNRSDELDIARKLVDGCIWAYDSMPTGIMPESFDLVPCNNPDDCLWSEERWHEVVMDENGFARTMDVDRIIREDGLVPGYTKIGDRRFLLRYVLLRSTTSVSC
jgi:mannosyl-oligosaccharide alpha-1,2-mannosidase